MVWIICLIDDLQLERKEEQKGLKGACWVEYLARMIHGVTMSCWNMNMRIQHVT